MEFKCPECQSLIYSRKHKTCGHCGAILPPELLLTDEQVRALEEERRREHQRTKDFDLGDAGPRRNRLHPALDEQNYASNMRENSIGRFLKRVIAANLLLAALMVFTWIGYASWAGLPLDSQCMGFRKGWKMKEPAWLSPVVYQTVFLILFAFRLYIGEPKVRLIIGGTAVWMLLFSFVLPILKSQVYGTEFYSFDRALWWYACVSGVAYALFGTASADDRPALAFR